MLLGCLANDRMSSMSVLLTSWRVLVQGPPSVHGLQARSAVEKGRSMARRALLFIAQARHDQGSATGARLAFLHWFSATSELTRQRSAHSKRTQLLRVWSQSSLRGWLQMSLDRWRVATGLSCRASTLYIQMVGLAQLCCAAQAKYTLTLCFAEWRCAAAELSAISRAFDLAGTLRKRGTGRTEGIFACLVDSNRRCFAAWQNYVQGHRQNRLQAELQTMAQLLQQSSTTLEALRFQLLIVQLTGALRRQVLILWRGLVDDHGRIGRAPVKASTVTAPRMLPSQAARRGSSRLLAPPERLATQRAHQKPAVQV